MNLQNDDTTSNHLDPEQTERSKNCNTDNILERQTLRICFLTTKEKQKFKYYTGKKLAWHHRDTWILSAQNWLNTYTLLLWCLVLITIKMRKSKVAHQEEIQAHLHFSYSVVVRFFFVSGYF